MCRGTVGRGFPKGLGLYTQRRKWSQPLNARAFNSLKTLPLCRAPLNFPSFLLRTKLELVWRGPKNLCLLTVCYHSVSRGAAERMMALKGPGLFSLLPIPPPWTLSELTVGALDPRGTPTAACPLSLFNLQRSLSN